MSSDRIDNNKGYCKENCMADAFTQAMNKRNPRVVGLKGVKRIE